MHTYSTYSWEKVYISGDKFLKNIHQPPNNHGILLTPIIWTKLLHQITL